MRLTVTLILNLLIIYIKKERKKERPNLPLSWDGKKQILASFIIPWSQLSFPSFIMLCFIDLAFLLLCKFLVWVHLITAPSTISHLPTLWNSSELITLAALCCPHLPPTDHHCINSDPFPSDAKSGLDMQDFH